MKERPILFSAPMVNAILDGRKTQTRRVIKKQPTPAHGKNKFKFTSYTDDEGINSYWTNKGFWHARCPYGKIGQRLWVRETFAKIDDESGYGSGYVEYKASCRINPDQILWTPSIHMPRWASRILLEITDVRVERLNDISIEDAIAEGTGIQVDSAMAIMEYSLIWESINGPGSWSVNPWVWCLTFKRIG